MTEDQSGADPDRQSTELERRVAEWLSPLRIYVIKNGLRLLLIIMFLVAAYTFIQFRADLLEYQAVLEAKGCVPGAVPEHLEGAMNRTWWNASNITPG